MQCIIYIITIYDWNCKRLLIVKSSVNVKSTLQVLGKHSRSGELEWFYATDLTIISSDRRWRIYKTAGGNHNENMRIRKSGL